MRRIALLVLWAAACGGPALAQMAAPSLIPGSPGVTDARFLHTPSFVPINPAAMSWRSYSTGGGGIARANATKLRFVHESGEVEPAFTYDFEDSYAGMVWKSGQYAFGLQAFSMTSSTPFFAAKNEGQDLAIAGRLREWFSIGAGYYMDRYEQVDEGVLITETVGLKLGVSGRFADSWYVGLTANQETVEDKYRGYSNDDWRGDRTGTALGVGFLNDGPARFHVEYWAKELGKVGDEDNGAILLDKTQSLVLEGAFSPWVAGLTVTSREQRISYGIYQTKSTSTGNEFTAGVVPEKGLALLFHYGFAEMQDSTSQVGTTKYTGVSRALSAVWIF